MDYDAIASQFGGKKIGQDRSAKIGNLAIEAEKAKKESEQANSFMGQAGTFGKELVGGLANAFLKQPARFAASAAAAPIDIFRGGAGQQPLDIDLPLVGKTFQRQASEDIQPIFDKAYSGEKVTAGDYGTALKPFAEVPLAAVEAVGLTKAVTAGAGSTKQAFQKSAEKAKDKYVADLLAPTKSAARTSPYVSNIKSGRMTEGGIFSGRNVTPDKFTSAIMDQVRSVPGIKSGQTNLKSLNLIHDDIGRTAENMRSSIVGRDIQPIVLQDDMNRLMERTKAEIGTNPVLVGDAQTTATRILDKFVSLLPKNRDITAVDVLDARQGLDSWMRSVKGDMVFDPKTENAVSIALRAVRQEANDLLAQKAQDVAVKEMLNRQSLLYEAVERIAPKVAKEAGSAAGRFLARFPLVKPTAQAIGAGVGFSAGGALIGSAFNAPK